MKRSGENARAPLLDPPPDIDWGRELPCHHGFDAHLVQKTLDCLNRPVRKVNVSKEFRYEFVGDRVEGPCRIERQDEHLFLLRERSVEL